MLSGFILNYSMALNGNNLLLHDALLLSYALALMEFYILSSSWNLLSYATDHSALVVIGLLLMDPFLTF